MYMVNNMPFLLCLWYNNESKEVKKEKREIEKQTETAARDINTNLTKEVLKITLVSKTLINLTQFSNKYQINDTIKFGAF